jgi:DNA polymerase-3 subunit alpha
VLSYWTAYLKANYPAEYMAALLTSVGDSKDKLGMYLSECRRMGINVLAPDVNESIAAFSAVGTDIKFGLGAVRNVGLNVVEGIVAARQDKGRFTSFHDFLRKVPAVVCSKRVIESLIKAGAFDNMGNTRRSLDEIHEEAVDEQASLKKNEANGQVDLFGSLFDSDPSVEESFGSSVPDRPEWSKKEKLAFERDMLGLYVSDHPLAGREAQLARYGQMTISELQNSETIADGETVTIAGLITSVQHRVARTSGNPYGALIIEDFEGELNVMLMGKTYQEFGRNLEADQVVVVRGRVSQRDDSKTVNAYSIETIEGSVDGPSGPIVVRLQEAEATREVLEELDRILKVHAGGDEVQIKLVNGAQERFFKLQPTVKISGELIGELKVLLGASCLS